MQSATKKNNGVRYFSTKKSESTMKQQHLAAQGVRADLKNAKNSLKNLRRNHPAEISVYPFHVTDSIQSAHSPRNLR